MSDQREYEELVERYVREGNNAEAINSLMFLIKRSAQQRDFEMAQDLRARIISIDPMALSEAIEAQDIIDSTRMRPTDSGHMEVWARLYERLIDYESRSLYNAMEETTFLPGQVIYSKGEMNKNLYFFDSGQAEHIYTHHGRNIFIKRIKAGNIAGDENFFNASCCTTTLIAIEKVRVNSLSYDRLKEETDDYDTILGKLEDFCTGGERIQDLLKCNAQDRRMSMRVPLKGSVLIKHSKMPNAKSLKGEMIDISAGGISFYVQAKNKAQALMLFGKNLSLRFNLPPKMRAVKKVGLVMAIRNPAASQQEKDKFSVHLKFDENLAEKHITQTNKFVKMIN